MSRFTLHAKTFKNAFGVICKRKERLYSHCIMTMNVALLALEQDLFLLKLDRNAQLYCIDMYSI